MISISRLYCGTGESGDSIRYAHHAHGGKPKPPAERRPVVVWNTTRRCNLNCVHCYSHSSMNCQDPEMDTEQAKAFLQDIADFGCKVILFSGGEPLLRDGILDLVSYASKIGLRPVFSTNGTMLTTDAVKSFKDAGLAYAGVSVDGLEETHDKFRGQKGAFQEAMKGVQTCLDMGVKVGFRFTITKMNQQDLPGLFDLIEAEGIPRFCMYHLVYAGRGDNLQKDDQSKEDARAAMDLIMDRTKALHDKKKFTEVLTVDNHCDGPYMYMRMKRDKMPGADEALKLMQSVGGNSTGYGIACVSWDGTVYADQFWRHQPLGNVTERPFSEILSDPNVTLLEQLRNRKPLLKGRCAACKWLDICNANFRVRAEAATGDTWAPDPACYLTDEEIGLPSVTPIH
ncbi:MAG: radical SAM protein [Planctomycetota bacterium]|jgi:radical SAM protein with 4Fe4S-binding SPASM domain